MLAMSMAIDNLAITGDVGKSTNTISLILSCLSAEFSHRQQPHRELTILAIMVSYPTPFNNSYVVFDMYSNVYISHRSGAHSG
jgi:hypothetical protein